MLELYPFDSQLPSGKSKNRRPHFYPGGGTFNISFRLAGSITRTAYYKLSKLWAQYDGEIPHQVYWSATAEERIGFRQFANGKTDRRSLNGPFHLHHDETCRQILADAFHFRDGEHYQTYCFSIMPNHVHWVVRHTSNTWHMGQLLSNLKRFVARQCNIQLELTGQPFWEEESWDRVIRTQIELEESIRYCLRNPTASRLTSNWEDWLGNYVSEEARKVMNANAFSGISE